LTRTWMAYPRNNPKAMTPKENKNVDIGFSSILSRPGVI
jgi:hypothetical protein